MQARSHPAGHDARHHRHHRPPEPDAGVIQALSALNLLADRL
jgi:hypothetical protein